MCVCVCVMTFENLCPVYIGLAMSRSIGDAAAHQVSFDTIIGLF